jgi:DNA polymerase-3 subunit delta'
VTAARRGRAAGTQARAPGDGALDDDARDDADASATDRAPMPRLPWLDEPLRALLAQRATLAHALLVTGATGTGKRNFAMHLAQALLCEAPRGDGLACGACASCVYFVAGQHPDFRLIELDAAEDDGEVKHRNEIPVDDIRALRELVQLTAHRGGRRVVVVDPAEGMNRAAANAFLKTLEEPPPGTFLVLVSHQPGRLPATIVSRCRRVALPRPPREAALRWLAAQGVAAPENALAQAHGAPVTALALADDALQDERRQWLAALAEPRALSPSALAARLDAVPKEGRRDRLAAIVDWLIAWSVDLARVAARVPVAANGDFAAALAALAPKVARISLSRYHRTLLRARARLAHPLTPRLTLEALLADYQALFDHARR